MINKNMENLGLWGGAVHLFFREDIPEATLRALMADTWRSRPGGLNMTPRNKEFQSMSIQYIDCTNISNT